jgi:hypothetical protein
MPDEKPKITGWTIFKGFLWILGAVAVLYSFHMHIKQVVQDYVNSPEFMRKVASQVRPSVIFDGKGSVIADLGAMQYIAEIKVRVGKDPLCPERIIITPTKHLSQAPLLQVADENSFHIKAERGVKYDWVYTLRGIVTIGLSDKPALFRLEIIQ